MWCLEAAQSSEVSYDGNGGVSQAHFVPRGEALEHVVAFCQQVKIHCKVPMFTTAPAVALKFWGLFPLLGPSEEKRCCQHRVY